MKKCFVSVLCYLGLLISLQDGALALQNDASESIVEYAGVEEAGQLTAFDNSSANLLLLADKEASKIKVTIHKRLSDIDEKTLRDLKRQAELSHDQPGPDNGHIPDLPDAADAHSEVGCQ